MNEKDIKIKVIEYLIKREKHFIVVPEVGLGNNSANTRGLSRADIFAVNGYISIYEIKSEKDTLKRVDTQITTYKKYTNKVNLVIAEKFLEQLVNIDEDIGVYVIRKNKIECIKEANFIVLDADAYLSYWWGSELKKLFRGCKDSNTLKYKDGLKKLRNLLNDNQIKNLTIFRLKERYKEESDFIKEAIRNKNYNTLFPKRKFKKNIDVTPLKDIPFGVINPIC